MLTIQHPRVGLLFATATFLKRKDCNKMCTVFEHLSPHRTSDVMSKGTNVALISEIRLTAIMVQPIIENEKY
jgi:hypothetical protein